MTRLLATAVVGVLLVSPAVVAQSYGTSTPAATPKPSPAATGAGQTTRIIAMTMQEFRFVPSQITVKVGRPVTLRLTNKGTMMHEFVAPQLFATSRAIAVSGGELEEGEEVHVARGKTVTIRLTPMRAGTFRFWCAERTRGQLHRDLGMRGVVTVTK